jgi:hypothetical protein
MYCLSPPPPIFKDSNFHPMVPYSFLGTVVGHRLFSAVSPDHNMVRTADPLSDKVVRYCGGPLSRKLTPPFRTTGQSGIPPYGDVITDAFLEDFPDFIQLTLFFPGKVR